MHPYTIPQQSGYHKWSMCSDTLAAPGTQHNLSIKFAVVTKVIVLLASSTYSTMASLTILIMITGLCLANSQADKCQYRYDIQPGPTINSPANSTRLILCCQVWSASNASGFSIQWHHSPTFPTAVSGADINTTIFDEDQIETKENATLKIVWSKLTLDDYKGTGDDGYYWCSVNVKDSNVSNPSTVAYVPFLNGTQTQTCNCGDGPAQNIISTQLLSTKLRCAESAISINKSDPENDICLQDDHRKPTRVEEDLMTTTPPEMDKITTADIDETNGSTPRGVTERLTTSPTTETSSGGRSTKHVATVETMTENAQYQETTTHITNSADTERLTTAESSRRDEIERIMLSFTMSVTTVALLSLIILACLIIGFCVRKLSKMRAKRHKKQPEHIDMISTPVDVYNMTTKTQLVRKESPLSSVLMCEVNTSYDVTPGTETAPSFEHVYDHIP